jgi:hypothetical protein
MSKASVTEIAALLTDALKDLIAIQARFVQSADKEEPRLEDGKWTPEGGQALAQQQRADREAWALAVRTAGRAALRLEAAGYDVPQELAHLLNQQPDEPAMYVRSCKTQAEKEGQQRALIKALGQCRQVIDAYAQELGARVAEDTGGGSPVAAANCCPQARAAQATDGGGSVTSGKERRENVFKLAGAVWHIRYVDGGEEDDFPDRRDSVLRRLAPLLAEPNRRFHAPELCPRDRGSLPTVEQVEPGTALQAGTGRDAASDDEAMRQYEKELRRLSGQIKEAEDAHDADTAAKLRSEFDTLAEHVETEKAAKRVGHRKRCGTASPAEQADQALRVGRTRLMDTLKRKGMPIWPPTSKSTSATPKASGGTRLRRPRHLGKYKSLEKTTVRPAHGNREAYLVEPIIGPAGELQWLLLALIRPSTGLSGGLSVWKPPSSAATTRRLPKPSASWRGWGCASTTAARPGEGRLPMPPANMPPSLPTGRGMTPREFARAYRLGPDWVRRMIRRGELGAINVARTQFGRPKFIIMPHHIVAWERGRAAAAPPKPQRRRRQPVDFIDFFPGD